LIKVVLLCKRESFPQHARTPQLARSALNLSDFSRCNGQYSIPTPARLVHSEMSIVGFWWMRECSHHAPRDEFGNVHFVFDVFELAQRHHAERDDHLYAKSACTGSP
jgi:hypothetical protein